MWLALKWRTCKEECASVPRSPGLDATTSHSFDPARQVKQAFILHVPSQPRAGEHQMALEISGLLAILHHRVITELLH